MRKILILVILGLSLSGVWSDPLSAEDKTIYDDNCTVCRSADAMRTILQRMLDNPKASLQKVIDSVNQKMPGARCLRGNFFLTNSKGMSVVLNLGATYIIEKVHVTAFCKGSDCFSSKAVDGFVVYRTIPLRATDI